MPDRFGLFLDALVARAHARLLQQFFPEQGDALAQRQFEMEQAAERLGYLDASSGDPVPQAFVDDPILLAAYCTGASLGAGMAEEDGEIQALDTRYPDASEERPLFCPQDHNALWTTRGWDECGACGALMTPEAEDDFENALVSAGQLQ